MPDDGRGTLAPTGWRVPAALAALGALAGLFVANSVSGLPVLPWSAIPTLLLLAFAEAFTARRTSRRIRREPGTEPMEPLSAARLLALAKASTLFAALALGFFAGMALAVTDHLALPTHRAVFLTCLGTALTAGLLLAAALYLEHACRVPEDRGDDEDRS
ncbi:MULTISPECIES: DUF3180 domain-containing protein [Nocardiopsis]|uniref:DUF3180 domain-containing protein n=2 Tax=Nocardiopsis alba TaxID=53437 RepID=A0A7K2IU52_9ACTN|nr:MULTISPECIES: DUF3180 domain-containing protein [Nocardiopsis]AFR07423.1 hypothetical protein B005_2562 [Nocardiopsis alba ATCC BAA-2165]MEC3893814.1 DUF3180 domain-containing protein [Nocardiopsis sp. LDBS1602]MYR33397.1 DUF3180 family protein [Nocardiopsis alba]